MNQLILGIIIGSLSGALISGLLVWFWVNSKSQKKISVLLEKITDLEKQHAIDSEQLKFLKISRDEIQTSFQSLASEVLQKNTESFLNNSQLLFKAVFKSMQGEWRAQKEEISGLVTPLEKNLSSLDNQVRELEQKREGAYRSVEEQIKQLGQTHVELQKTTGNLTHALKSSSVRGQWGELQLRRVVELAGMKKHIDYDEQVATDQGRPDMIVYLPNGGFLPIDSKSPMSSYFEAVESTDKKIQDAKFLDHARAMRSRAIELAKKTYWQQFDPSPEFVIMFIPNEASLSVAFENAPELLEEMLSKKVLIATPVTLLALLKAVAHGWQQYGIAENSREIALEGQELCNRMRIFSNHLGDIGDSLGKAIEQYNKSIGSFERRVLPSMRRFENMNIISDPIVPPESIEQTARSIDISDE
ncbi:MAG: DNA recombination protein RmuC [Anaerolineae bacterium]|jgi:DNA recombination protein RmuC|nr:DNA recombination protein RmuC [Anaerolineae bacterium]MBT6321778.1 DNA recombination protein RmuC [Anaerolineae bacterium]MBT6813316.1 DNA recombination protein RmuC [Anaerolineae bacterium]MBT7016914.1 DNA recombination protein RmuC [Anaerolineae bacterium]MBT7773874.1 DNA recombination protein RmuC [Anaerolineae bacterium]